jgi:hypothetical protein
VFMMVRSGEWLPKKSLRLGVWSTIFGSRDIPGCTSVAKVQKSVATQENAIHQSD